METQTKTIDNILFWKFKEQVEQGLTDDEYVCLFIGVLCEYACHNRGFSLYSMMQFAQKHDFNLISMLKDFAITSQKMAVDSVQWMKEE